MNIMMICIGASLGALSRWQLGRWLNQDGAALAWGTLSANWLGCLMMGVALAYSLSDQTKLLLVTGFLGSFTTFSAFSGEVVNALLRGQFGLSINVLVWHIIGGLAWTMGGVCLGRWLH